MIKHKKNKKPCQDGTEACTKLSLFGRRQFEIDFVWEHNVQFQGIVAT